MKLVKYNPTRDMVTFSNVFDRFFDNFGYYESDVVWKPIVDLAENEDGYEVYAELPGLKKDEINISLKENVLTLTGEKKHEDESKKKNYHRIERRYGKFERSFHIPKNIKSEEIKAKFKNGVLTISIPKAEEAKPKEISVS